MLVSAEWFAEHVGDPDLVVLDARPRVSYLYGHIPGSLSATIESVVEQDRYGAHLVIPPRQAAKTFGGMGIDETKKVVVYGDMMDPSAARVAWTLLYYGHSEVSVLNAPIGALQGVSPSRKREEARQAQFVPKANPSVRAEPDVLSGQHDFVVADARTPQEYMAGHLPGAVLIPYTDGISDGGASFRNAEGLRGIFGGLAPEDREIVCYCMHGHRAASLLVQMKHAGYERVRLYDGSFVQWSGLGLPLE